MMEGVELHLDAIGKYELHSHSHDFQVKTLMASFQDKSC